uniref:Uncharacterized protein n=1 Tax=Oryza punctata TaxID=4537 RepID=A0A0E0JEJ3_ORYPU
MRRTIFLAIQIGRWRKRPCSSLDRCFLHLQQRKAAREAQDKRGKEKEKAKAPRRRGRDASHQMASPPPPGRPAWSITVRLRHRGWLDLRAAAENVVFPGCGRGGERLSLLLRLRRSLRLAVTCRCSGGAPPEKNPRACKIIRFLRSKLARFPSILRRKKPPPAYAAIAASKPGSRSQLWRNRALAWPAHGGRKWPAKTTATAALCLAAALAVVMASIAAFRAMNAYGRGYYEPVGHSKSWRFLVAKKIARWLELEPRLYAWLMKISLNRLLNW